MQEKLSSLDGRPQSLAGRAADDAGDCPHMTRDLTFAHPLCPKPDSAYSHYTPSNTLLSLTPECSIAKLMAVAKAFLQLSTANLRKSSENCRQEKCVM